MPTPLVIEKAIGTVPNDIVPNGLYLVRVDKGYDLKVADTTGAVVFDVNNPKKKLKLTADITKAVNSTRFALPSLALPVQAGKMYELSYYLLASCTYPYSGAGISFDFPAGTMNLLVQRVRRQNDSSAFEEGYITSTSDKITDARTFDTDKLTPIHCKGLFNCTEDGTVTPYIELAGLFGNVTVSNQSYLVYQAL